MRYETSLSNFKEGSKSSSTQGNNQVDTRGLNNPVVTYTRRDKATPDMIITHRLDHFSSWSSSGKVSKSFERYESRKWNQAQQQCRHPDTFPNITQTPQMKPYSSATLLGTKNSGYCRFCFDPLQWPKVCPIDPPSFWPILLYREPFNRTGAFANTPYGSMNRWELQHQGPVRVEAYHVPARSPIDFENPSGSNSSRPGSFKQINSLN